MIETRGPLAEIPPDSESSGNKEWDTSPNDGRQMPREIKLQKLSSSIVSAVNDL